MYAAQEKAVLQEFHFILKKISDRVSIALPTHALQCI